MIFSKGFRSTIHRWRERQKLGLPPGLHRDIFDNVVSRLQFGKILSVRHTRLRGWRRSGTYRIFLTFKRRRKKTLIYKKSVYSLKEIPANKDLPIKQGPPEFLIAGERNGPILEFVPINYWKAKDIKAESFEYLFEDLNDEYENFVEHNKKKSIISVCKNLAEMHRALRNQFSNKSCPEFINFDNKYSNSIWEYTLEALPGYFHLTQDPTVKRFFDYEEVVKSVFLDHAFYFNRPTQVIHGDCNGTNMWVKQGLKSLMLKAVDWEWAGYGMPHADLISILKWRSEEEKEAFLRCYCSAAGLEDITQEMRWLRRANMERAILDAGFLAKQYQNPAHSKEWFKKFIRGSLEHLMHEATVLQSGKIWRLDGSPQG